MYYLVHYTENDMYNEHIAYRTRFVIAESEQEAEHKVEIAIIPNVIGVVMYTEQIQDLHVMK